MTGLKPEQITNCVQCDGPLVGNVSSGKTGDFYRITVSRYMPDHRALQQRAGLTAIFASGGGPIGAAAAIADVFAPSSEVAFELPGTLTVNVCFKCLCSTPLPEIMERHRREHDLPGDLDDDEPVKC